MEGCRHRPTGQANLAHHPRLAPTAVAVVAPTAAVAVDPSAVAAVAPVAAVAAVAVADNMRF